MLNLIIFYSILENLTYSEKIQDALNSNFLKNSISDFNHHLNQSVFNNAPLSSAEVVLLTAGIIIFLGVLGEAFFRRTGIPDIAFLMAAGVVVGPVLGIVSTATVVKIVPYFASLALIIIMFDGGLNLDVRSIIRTAHYAFLLAIFGFVVSVAIVSIIAVYGLGWQLLDGILLGIMVGGSSSIVVFGLVRNLMISADTKAMLSLESAITDILATVGAFLLFNTITSGHLNPSLIGITAAKSVSVGLVLGFGVGIPWMFVFSRLQNARHAYMLTLGILFVLFFLAKSFGGTGAITALIFGLMLGNRNLFAKRLKIKMPEVSTDNSFHDQLTFLVRTFFFVFVGLLANFGQIGYLVFGVLMAIIIYFGRIAVTKTSLTKRFSTFDKKVTSVMIPRGLAAAVLATIPLTLRLNNADAYPQIVFVIIISTVIITTIGLAKAKKNQTGSMADDKIKNQ
ncbi:MAG: cation:proton antiporter [Thaumarchaeota archaeon]|nr:cation:proton antiporter [Nitrososphaerota archaeon]